MKKTVLLALLLLGTIGMYAQNVVLSEGEGTSASSPKIKAVMNVIPADAKDNYDYKDVQSHQLFEIHIVGKNDYTGIALEFAAPQSSKQNSLLLHVSKELLANNGLVAQLSDEQGKLLREYKMEEERLQIDFDRAESGNYRLNIIDGKNLLKVFSIKKNRL